MSIPPIAADVVGTIKALENHEFFCKTLDEEGIFALGCTFCRVNQESWADQPPPQE